jgi:putative oxidoreductase
VERDLNLMSDLNLTIDDRPQRIDLLRTWLPRIAVTIAFLGFGWQKFEGDRFWIRVFDQIGFGQWFRYFTGAMQVTGAILVLIPRTFLLGMAMLACTLLGAITFWIVVARAPGNAVIPGFVLIALLAVSATRAKP